MWTTMPSPIGDLRLVESGGALAGIDFSPWKAPLDAADKGMCDVLVQAVAQLEGYFAGELREFDLPLALAGTPFQQRVWRELLHVGYGTTATYGQVAARLGLPIGAARAIGAANARNPVPVVVGCHRVIGANGSLTGYAGGLDRKRYLLDLEASGLQPGLYA